MIYDTIQLGGKATGELDRSKCLRRARFEASVLFAPQGEKGRGIKEFVWVTTVLLAGSLCAVGCAQQDPAAEGDASGEGKQYANSIEESEAVLAEENARWQEINKEYAPEIRTLEDGTKVQRTPSEYQCYHWNRPMKKVRRTITISWMPTTVVAELATKILATPCPTWNMLTPPYGTMR